MKSQCHSHRDIPLNDPVKQTNKQNYITPIITSLHHLGLWGIRYNALYTI